MTNFDLIVRFYKGWIGWRDVIIISIVLPAERFWVVTVIWLILKIKMTYQLRIMMTYYYDVLLYDVINLMFNKIKVNSTSYDQTIQIGPADLWPIKWVLLVGYLAPDTGSDILLVYFCFSFALCSLGWRLWTNLSPL